MLYFGRNSTSFSNTSDEDNREEQVELESEDLWMFWLRKVLWEVFNVD